jgi:RNA polymerase sigma-70 factor (ECF subfamily)
VLKGDIVARQGASTGPTMMWLLAAISTLSAPTGDQVDDLERLAGAARGDGAALAVLYDRHARGVFSIAIRVLRDEGDAEDVVQEVFAQVWRQASRYDATHGSVAAWLLTMARSRAIDRLRTRLSRPDDRSRAVAWSDDVWGGRAAPLVDPSDALTAERDARRVKESLDRLPLMQRLAIELAYFEGLTQSQIAERLEQPLGTQTSMAVLAAPDLVRIDLAGQSAAPLATARAL